MATANALPTQTADPVLEAGAAEPAENEQALVPTERALATPDLPALRLTPALSRLPVEIDVAVPVRNFRVRDLLNLAHGAIIATQWLNGEDLPLQAGQVQLAWAEFEVVDTQLAVRVTRLA